MRKITTRGREQSNVSPAKTECSRENTSKFDEKAPGGGGSSSERRTAKQRKPGLMKTL